MDFKEHLCVRVCVCAQMGCLMENVDIDCYILIGL